MGFSSLLLQGARDYQFNLQDKSTSLYDLRMTSASSRACYSSAPSPLHDGVYSNIWNVPLQGKRLGDWLAPTLNCASQHNCILDFILLKKNCTLKQFLLYRWKVKPCWQLNYAMVGQDLQAIRFSSMITCLFLPSLVDWSVLFWKTALGHVFNHCTSSTSERGEQEKVTLPV